MWKTFFLFLHKPKKKSEVERRVPAGWRKVNERIVSLSEDTNGEVNGGR